jgi:hypothetical protein
MVKKFRIAFAGACVVALACLVALWGGAVFSNDVAVAQNAAPANSGAPAVPTPPPYPTVGIRTGVYNDGQAALWDLNITDHFHYFGPQERARGYRPEQPIHFSHVLHVQKNRMECQFCHWSVAKSEYAAIPEVETCIGCHKENMVKDSELTPRGQEDVKKIRQYYKDGQPIPWVKVHVMPDYVRFNHKRHIKAGVACSECHGQVPEMDVVERVSSMKMGWCVSCHRQRGASIDCLVCHGQR